HTRWPRDWSSDVCSPDLGTGKHFLSIIVGLSLLVAACAPPGAPGSPQKPSGPVKVGFLAPTTGTSAASGNDMINGWKLYWKTNEIGRASCRERGGMPGVE